MHSPSPILLCLVSVLAILMSSSLPAQEFPGPKVVVENVRRAYHNGEHNAFTDLVRWRGAFWMTFRSCPDGHMVFSSSSIRILRSVDAREWTEIHRFSVPQRDTRDPHFLVFDDRLFVYTGTWWSGEGELPREKYNLNQHLGYAVHSGDGSGWSEPVALEGTYGHYIWRAAARGGKAYLCGRRKLGFTEKEDGSGVSEQVQSAMLVSEDGLVFRFHSLFQETKGNETAFLFKDDGSLVAVSRRDANSSDLILAKEGWHGPEEDEKVRIELSEFIGGPLLARWSRSWYLLVGGRRNTPGGPRTALYWLAGDRLEPFAELPSDGNNSYPGFVELDDGRGLVSWYSSHEKDAEGRPITAIYLADLVIAEP